MSMDRCYMTTYTGLVINPLDPDPDKICIEDIAHHLALECRYNGACKFHYSVAQHSVIGVLSAGRKNGLPFLLHDGSEAYMHDLVKGLKDNISYYKEAEVRLQKVIYEKFNIVDVDYVEIKRIDYALMAAEVKVLMKSTEGWTFPEPALKVDIIEWQWRTAEQLFLEYYDRLVRVLPNV